MAHMIYKLLNMQRFDMQAGMYVYEKKTFDLTGNLVHEGRGD